MYSSSSQSSFKFSEEHGGTKDISIKNDENIWKSMILDL